MVHLKLLIIHLTRLKKVSAPRPSVERRIRFWILLYGMNPCIFFTSGTHFNDTPCLSLDKEDVIFHLLFKSKKMVFIHLWNAVSHVFIFYDYSIQREMKNGHFMPAQYTLYLAHKAMGIFYTIHRYHHVSFLAFLHPHWSSLP